MDGPLRAGNGGIGEERKKKGNFSKKKKTRGWKKSGGVWGTETLLGI